MPTMPVKASRLWLRGDNMRLIKPYGVKRVVELNLIGSANFEVWYGVARVESIQSMPDGNYWVTYRLDDGSLSRVLLQHWQTLTVYEKA